MNRQRIITIFKELIDPISSPIDLDNEVRDLNHSEWDVVQIVSTSAECRKRASDPTLVKTYLAITLLLRPHPK